MTLQRSSGQHRTEVRSGVDRVHTGPVRTEAENRLVASTGLELGVSVAMATYNGEAHIRAQLDSLARQSRLPVELVVTDDGSTDATTTIVEDFARTAPFPVVLHRNPARLGWRANFMHAASLCVGELIAFCDQDDLWFEGKLERAAAQFSNPDVVLFHHEARIVREGAVLSERLGKVRDQSPLVPVLQSAPWLVPPGFALVFRAWVTRFAHLWTDSIDFNHPEHHEAHDEWYFFLASVLGTIAYEPKPLADYRQHQGNAVGRSTASFGLRQRFAFLVENRSLLYKKLSWVARRRSDILVRAAASGCPDQQSSERLCNGAHAWGQLAEFYRLRADVYAGTHVARARAFAALAARSAYGRKAFWSFRPKAFVKDLCLGVLFGPLVTRYGPTSTGVDWTCVAGKAG